VIILSGPTKNNISKKKRRSTFVASFYSIEKHSVLKENTFLLQNKKIVTIKAVQKYEHIRGMPI
jgi:hypothetical protein